MLKLTDMGTSALELAVSSFRLAVATLVFPKLHKLVAIAIFLP